MIPVAIARKAVGKDSKLTDQQLAELIRALTPLAQIIVTGLRAKRQPTTSVKDARA